MPPRSATPLVLAGVALIVFPLLAVGLRILNPGWFLIFLLVGMPLIVVIYALQVVMASSFLTNRGVFATTARRGQALTAAWMSAGGALAAAFFAPDVGDTGVASPFLILINGPYQLYEAMQVLAALLTIVAVAGWGWLFVEWVIAIRARKAAREAGGYVEG